MGESVVMDLTVPKISDEGDREKNLCLFQNRRLET